MTKHHLWTPEEDKRLRQLHARHVSWSMIAAELGLSYGQCMERGMKLGVKRKGKRQAMIGTSIFLPEVLLDAFKELADRKSITISRYVRLLLIRELKQYRVDLDYEDMEDY